MKNRIEPAITLTDYRTIRENVERKVRRRRSRSTPPASEINAIDERLRSHIQTADSENSNAASSGKKAPLKLLTEQVVDVVSAENHIEYLHKELKTNVVHYSKSKSDKFNTESVDASRRKKSSNVLPSIFSSTRKAASKWKHYVSHRREDRKFRKHFEILNLKKLLECGEKRRSTLVRESFGFLEEEFDGYDGSKQSMDEIAKKSHVKSKELIRYFISLSKSKKDDSKVELDYVETLIEDGADLNWPDKHGQTVLHEVARIWHPDVAQFLIEHGAAVDKVDKYGRSPLHVAAAVDFSEMVEFLLSKGADINLRTLGEEQTPVHYAAKNDACNSLATLLDKGASIEDRDFKERTPLQLGAELDRSEACKILLNEGAPAGVWDDSGMSCMNLMIQKMPPVALEALDQFHIKDRANRKQYFYLSYLEPPMAISPTSAKSSLKVAVEDQQFAIVMHPVMQRLTEVKWKWFGKLGACVHFTLNLLFCVTWTALICSLPNDIKDMYTPLGKKSYRIVLEIAVICVLFYWIINEYMEYRNSIRERDEYIRWRESELIRDLKYCHPRWPEERAYIEREIAELGDLKPSYLVDWWNYFDWLTYASIIGTIICHVVSVAKQSTSAFRAEKGVGSVMLVLQWTRLMKFVRAFHPLGPFVVILRHVISDTGRFAFLFFIFYIPYAASLWVLFGKRSVSGYSNFEELAYNLLQITVVGDFGFENLTAIDGRMARLLCGTYIVVSGIVCLNLFIALLSDTFQRVYDNVQANTQMLRASRVLNFEDNFAPKRREKYQHKIHMRCSPEVSYYDDDMTDPSETELKRMTHQIKTEIDNVKKYLHDKFGTIEEDHDNNQRSKRQDTAEENDLTYVKQEINVLKSNYEHSVKIINMQLMSINSMLSEVLTKKKKGGTKKGTGKSRTEDTSTADVHGKVVAVAPMSVNQNESHA